MKVLTGGRQAEVGLESTMKIVTACTEEVVTGAQIQNREDNVLEDGLLGPKDGKDGNPFLAKKILRLD